MATIKVRAWYPVDKKYVFTGEILDFIDKLDKGFNWDLLVFELYTGLTGKSGIEIFDGDILQFKAMSYMDYLDRKQMTKVKRKIGWSKEKLCWWVGKPDTGFQPDMETDNNEFEVIGNINANPELLDG